MTEYTETFVYRAFRVERYGFDSRSQRLEPKQKEQVLEPIVKKKKKFQP